MRINIVLTDCLLYLKMEGPFINDAPPYHHAKLLVSVGVNGSEPYKIITDYKVYGKFST